MACFYVDFSVTARRRFSLICRCGGTFYALGEGENSESTGTVSFDSLLIVRHEEPSLLTHGKDKAWWIEGIPRVTFPNGE